jgi:hypothetical protein
MKRALNISLIALAFLSGLVLANAGAIASPAQQQKSRIIKLVKSSSAVQIYADNSQGSLLNIQEARVKEISDDDFTRLVGEPPKHSILTTFPNVILVNGYPKTIRSFAIVVQSAAEKPRSGYILLKKELSIPPNSAYEVTSSEWPQAERVSIQKGNKFVSRLRQPGLDSAKSWIPGAASDLRITVGLVEFEDGTKWKIPPGSSW